MTAPQLEPASRLLLTGVTGFIGSRFLLQAHRQGLDVLGTGRVSNDLERERWLELRAAKTAVEAGLLQDAELARGVVAGRTHVIHLAAAQHESAMPEAYFRSINVDALRVLLEASAQAGVKRFVYGGTIGVYGETDCGRVNEASPTAPDNMYTRTKLEAEDVVRSFADRMEVCIVRIPETYGPGDYRLLKLFRAIDRGRFFMIGGGENRRQCLHVQDLIDGLLLAAAHPAAAGELFVYAGREVMTTKEMVRAIATALDRPVPHARAPMWPFLATARVMETVLPPLHIAPPLHSRRLDFFRKTLVFDTTKAQRVLGFTPQIDFMTGAADAARWYRARGLLCARHSDELARTTESA